MLKLPQGSVSRPVQVPGSGNTIRPDTCGHDRCGHDRL